MRIRGAHIVECETLTRPSDGTSIQIVFNNLNCLVHLLQIVETALVFKSIGNDACVLLQQREIHH